MTEDELWERYETARKELIAFYLFIIDGPARHFARITGRDNWEDLKQDGVIGLMKAIEKYRRNRGVDFRVFAKKYVRGAILESPELTRGMSRTQREIYSKARRAEDSLTKPLHRNPTIEEIAKKTRLTIEQIRNAFAALGITNPAELSDDDDISSSSDRTSSPAYSQILIEESLAHLTELEQKIIRLHYMYGMPHEKIAEELEIIPVEVREIRERAIGKVAKACNRAMGKLRKRVDVEPKGNDNENKRSRK